MKKLALLTFLIAMVAMGQPGPQQINLNAPSPTPVEQLSTTLSGTGGQTTYYYYIVANYPIGSVVSNGFAAQNGPATISGGGFFILNWNAIAGVTNYTILRTTTPNVFTAGAISGQCSACIVVQNLTTTTYNDITTPTLAYTLNGVPGAAVQFYLNNQSYLKPYVVVGSPNPTTDWKFAINGTAPALHLLQNGLNRATFFISADGTKLELGRYNDAGVYVDDYLSGLRATGDVTFYHNITITGTCTGCGAGNPAGSNTQLQYNAAGVFGGTAEFTYVSPTISATSAGKLDLSASTVASAFKIPVVAGLTVAINGALGYDSTNNMLHGAQGSADAYIPQFTVSPANNDCVKWVVSGSQFKLGTQGAACGSGGGSGALSALTAAVGANSISNGDNAQVWQFSLTTASKSAFTFGEAVAGTSAGTPYLVNIQTLATSTVNPFIATALGTTNGVRVLKSGFLSSAGTGGTDSNMLYCDVTDGTKCIQMVLSGITTATTRNITFPNAASTVVLATPSTTTTLVLHASATSGVGVYSAIATGDLPAAVVLNNAVNTATASMTLDMSASTVANAFRVPVIAGATAGANGVVVYDSTAGITHIRTNGADSLAVATTTTSTTTTLVLHATAVAGVYTPSAIAGGDLPASAVQNNQVNTATTAMTLNLSASTVASAFRVPVVAGLTATVNGGIGYDSTNNMLHAAQSSADAFVPQFTITPTNAHCVVWVVSGSNYKLGDSACSAAVALSAITAATGGNTLANGDNAQVWNFALTTAGKVGFTFGETTAATSTGTPYVLQAISLIGSTATPLNVTNSLNGSQILPALSITPTWNTTGVVDAALFVNVTNTASGAASKLIDLQIGGTTEFNVDKTGLVSATAGYASGATPPTVTAGTGGVVGIGEGTVPSVCAASTVDCIYADSTQHGLLASFNNGSYLPLVQGIASGTSALGTSSIASGACATVVTTTATGTASTDTIEWTPNASIKAVTGYTPATTGGLSIAAYPTSGNVNFDVCNWSSGSLTPGAVTLNWRVVR